MEEQKTYIEQETAEESLYLQLQEHTLDEIQRMSGKVWTDYNMHDPGVTLAEASNSMLSELDYKLSFELADYLTNRQGNTEYERMGLFPVNKVYTTAPVTAKDYRKLFITHFPTLKDIRVEADVKTGNYNIRYETSPFDERKDEEKEIRQFFHTHRNLCENLSEVTQMKPEQLTFHSELEIKAGYDATSVLAEIYHTILQYLSGSIKIQTLKERPAEGISLDKWMEGSENGIHIAISEQEDTEHELYLKLLKIDGIKWFKSCYFQEEDEILTDFKKGYSLVIPYNAKELQVKIVMGQTEIQIDIERFLEKLQALYYSERTIYANHCNATRQNIQTDESLSPHGIYREIFEHHPLGKDLPSCYHVQGKNTEIDQKMFDAYLKLYDLVVERGLKEIKEMQKLLSIEEETGKPSEMEIVVPAIGNVKKHSEHYKDVYTLKNTYMNFLDGFYGVDSNPEWMKEFNYYGETKDEQLSRRMNFLRHAPELTKNRYGARDITIADSPGNVPAAKKYFCCLLGMQMNEEISIGNVLHIHSLNLHKHDENKKELHSRLNAMLIQEKMLDKAHVEPVSETEAPATEEKKKEQYQTLRDKLDIFKNNNTISGGLFRGGIRLDNYKLVHVKELEYILVFWNKEENYWMNLEWGTDPKLLNEYANILRRYLWDLNNACETVYIIEHNLLLSPEPFTVSVLFPDWTARFHSPRFREICMQLMRSLIPPHVKVCFYLADSADMQSFELCYSLWRRILSKGNQRSSRQEIENSMMSLLKVSKQAEI